MLASIDRLGRWHSGGGKCGACSSFKPRLPARFATCARAVHSPRSVQALSETILGRRIRFASEESILS